MVHSQVFFCCSKCADLATIYDYITKVFPYYKRVERTSATPGLRKAIEKELNRESSGFIKAKGKDGLWTIDPDWDGKTSTQPAQPVPGLSQFEFGA